MNTMGSNPASPRWVGRPWWVISLTVVLAVLAADQATKAWALRALEDGHVIDLVWTLRFRLTFNSGMAFGAGSGLGPVIGVVALVVVVALLLSMRKTSSLLSVVSVGLVIGGALGNLVDRVFRADGGLLTGRVVDFVDLQWWPVFNIADAGIVVGGVLLVLANWRASRPVPAAPAAPTGVQISAEALSGSPESAEEP